MKRKIGKLHLSAIALSVIMLFSSVPMVFAATDQQSGELQDCLSASDVYNAIGGKKVAELDNNKITLTKNAVIKYGIKINCPDVVIDLNGKNLNADFTSSNIIQVSSGKLTIQASNRNSNGYIRYLTDVNNYAVRLTGGSLVLNSGSVQGIEVMNADVTINGGSIYSDSVSGVLDISYDSNVVMNNGFIYATFDGVRVGSKDNTRGNFTMNNGSIRSKRTDGIYVMNGSANINSGVVTASNFYEYNLFAAVVCNTSELNITGGRFISNKTALITYASLDKTISGGQFISDETAIWIKAGDNSNIDKIIKDGYKLVDNLGRSVDPSCRKTAKEVMVVPN